MHQVTVTASVPRFRTIRCKAETVLYLNFFVYNPELENEVTCHVSSLQTLNCYSVCIWIICAHICIVQVVVSILLASLVVLLLVIACVMIVCCIIRALTAAVHERCKIIGSTAYAHTSEIL